MNNNIVEFGLKNVHVAVGTEGALGVITYAAPVAVPGAVTLKLEEKSDMYKFFADDRVYFSEAQSEGAEGTLEMALFPDSFKIDILGFIRDEDGGLAEKLNANSKPFALVFECDGDKNKARHIYFNCKAGKISDEYKTGEGKKNVKTQTLPITVMGDENGYLKVRYNEGEAGYAKAITTIPTITPAPVIP